MPSFKSPTKSQIDAVVQRCRSPELAAHFFSRSQNPEWITPLEKNGLFGSPPPAIRVDGGGAQYPHWPASRYLARMAAHNPGEVAEVFASMETDNAFVIGDMLSAALAMPGGVAVALVPAVCRAAKAGTLWMHFKDASDLCVRLAEGGKLDAAMTLAETLFDPTLEEDQEEPDRRDKYWFEDGLRKVVPVLARTKAREFLPMLCDWLAVRAKEHVDEDSGSDLSYLWRPAIEEHGQNHDYDSAGVMVGFVRDGLEQAIRAKQLSLKETLRIVEGYQYLVFKRINLHLIAEFAEQAPDLARQAILNPDLFHDYQFKHEYAMLVGRRLNDLQAEQRDEWFGWIDAGPRKDEVEQNIAENVQKSQAEWWRYQKLHWVQEHLQGERKAFHERMRAEHGEPELADLNVYIESGHWGHDSPRTLEDLSGMTFDQAVHDVSTWQPEEPRFRGPSKEGLASTFKQYVATKPEEFSRKAGVLVDCPPIFVRGFISQMSEAVNDGRKIDLPPVLKLCKWIVGRPAEERSTPEQEDETDVDTNWQWTRDEVAGFVKNVCAARSGDGPSYPVEGIREPLWSLIESLCRDRAKSNIVHDIAEDDPRIRDYLDLGINSPRGKAVDAALEYARWVNKHIKDTTGFDDMPEVRNVLEWQIAPENRSFEAMSIIGSNISTIYGIDKKWLAENAGRLFDLKGIEKTPPMAEGWAAWNAFLVWRSPYVEFYRLFKAEFAYAVEQAAKVELTEHTRIQPMHSLGKHLMILYGHGQLGLDEDGGILRRFIEKANSAIRIHAIGFVGQSMEGDKKVPDEVVERFMKLWEFYWNGPGKKDAKAMPDAGLFGTWFSCGKFPVPWSLDCLGQFVAIAPIPGPEHSVAERLAEIAHIDILKSVQILDRMVRGDREGWRVHSWLDPVMGVLEHAMRTPGEAQKKAEALIDHLGRRGYNEFGRLLK